MKHSIKNALRIFMVLILCQATVTVPMWNTAKQYGKRIFAGATTTPSICASFAAIAYCNTKQKNTNNNNLPYISATELEKKFVLNTIAEVTDFIGFKIMKYQPDQNRPYLNASYSLGNTKQDPNTPIITIEHSNDRPSLQNLLALQQCLENLQVSPTSIPDLKQHSKLIEIDKRMKRMNHIDVEEELNCHKAFIQHEIGHFINNDFYKEHIIRNYIPYATSVGLAYPTSILMQTIKPLPFKIISYMALLTAHNPITEAIKMSFRRDCETKADRCVKNDLEILHALEKTFERYHRNTQRYISFEKEQLENKIKILPSSIRSKIASHIIDIKHYIQSFFSSHPPSNERAAECRHRREDRIIQGIERRRTKRNVG